MAERADWLRYRVTPEALLDAIGAEVIDLLPPESEGERGEPSAA